VQVTGEQIGSLGERLPRAQDYDLTRPELEEVMQRILFKRKEQKRPPVKRAQVKRDVRPEELAKDIVQTMEIIPNDIAISNYRLGTTPLPIDTRLKSRTDIIVANMSTNIVWINSNANVLSPGGGNYVGIPLSPAAGAATYDGGVWRARIRENIRWWGVATGANSLIVVVELARR